MEEQIEKLVKEKEDAVERVQNSMDIVPLASILVTRVSTSTITSNKSTVEGVE